VFVCVCLCVRPSVCLFACHVCRIRLTQIFWMNFHDYLGRLWDKNNQLNLGVISIRIPQLWIFFTLFNAIFDTCSQFLSFSFGDYPMLTLFCGIMFFRNCRSVLTQVSTLLVLSCCCCCCCCCRRRHVISITEFCKNALCHWVFR